MSEHETSPQIQGAQIYDPERKHSMKSETRLLAQELLNIQPTVAHISEELNFVSARRFPTFDTIKKWVSRHRR